MQTCGLKHRTTSALNPTRSLYFYAFSACATMKLTTITVKVCSTEFNDSRSKGTVMDDCREAAPESKTELRTGQPQRR